MRLGVDYKLIFLLQTIFWGLVSSNTVADTPNLTDYLKHWSRFNSAELATNNLYTSPKACPTYFCLSRNANDSKCLNTIEKSLNGFPRSTINFCKKLELVKEKNKPTNHADNVNFTCRQKISIAIQHKGNLTLDQGVLEFCDESPIKGKSKAGPSGKGALYNSKLQKICTSSLYEKNTLVLNCNFGRLSGSFLQTRGSGRATEIYATNGDTTIFMLTRKSFSRFEKIYPDIFK